MPTPPAESIGGKKMYQEDAFTFSKKTYDYIVQLEEFQKTEEHESLSQEEKDSIAEELKALNESYETLNERVSKY